MLRYLNIRDFVIVDQLELAFGPGFTVLTGETGAGKSILIDALGLLLGERAEAGVVRSGRERAELNAEFDVAALPKVTEWLRDNELQGDEGVCLIRRQIDAGGRSRSFINGQSATLQQLREVGEMLVDIQGQHAHLSLLKAASRRELLDAYGALGGLAGEVAKAYRAWQALHKQRQEWEKNSTAIEAEAEQLQWQVKELESLAFNGDEWQELQAEHSRLSHAASLVEGAAFGLDLLSEGEFALLSQLSGLSARLGDLLEYDSGLKEALEFVAGAEVQLQEAVYSLRHYSQRLDLDPERLQQCEQRLRAIHDCARKYRTEPEQLPRYLAQWRQRLAELGGQGGGEGLAAQEEQARADFLAVGQRLSAGRAMAAEALAEEVGAAMQQLAMSGGRFEIALAPVPEGAAFGLEQVDFRVAAHAGMDAKPLEKVASGGELSRISLGVQVASGRVVQVPTLVFDEVDVGIGGGVAEIVGNMLKDLGAERQVLCITHLPQVAALGDRHWQVSKAEKNGEVLSAIAELDPAQRVEEIARMLGGVEITERTRAHAVEMLGMR
ncbi:MAG: DNA repair protein RecN [Sulfuricellaceae bacterium]|nr:DNA repair protein RecN [Sulfuricellaceae bacterium]